MIYNQNFLMLTISSTKYFSAITALFLLSAQTARTQTSPTHPVGGIINDEYGSKFIVGFSSRPTVQRWMGSSSIHGNKS